MKTMSEEEFRAKQISHMEASEKFQARMTTAIFGDEQAKIKGLAQRQQDSEDYIEKDKKFKAKVAGGLFVVSVAGVPLWEWLKKHFLGL